MVSSMAPIRSGRVRRGAGAARRPRRAARAGAAQAQSERERRRQQEVGVPQRVLEHGCAQRSAGPSRRQRAGGGRTRRQRRAPPGTRATSAQVSSASTSCGERQAEFDGELQRQVVGVVEERAGRLGNGVSVQAKLNSPKPTPEPRMGGDQRERVGPDARSANSRCRRPLKPLLAAEAGWRSGVALPSRQRQPEQGVDQRRQPQEHTLRRGQAAGRRRPRAPA